MRRLVFGLVLALCALTPSAASAATEVEAEFKLPASNGLSAEVEARGEGIALAVLDADPSRSSGRYTVYETKAEVLESGIEASFGALGHISFQFHTTSSDSGPAGSGCKGQRGVDEEGIFEGEAEFRGEDGYVRIDVGRVRGKLSIRPCQNVRAQTRPAAAKPRRETGALLARAKDGRFFYASGETDRRGPDYASFLGELAEHSEGMLIGRVAYASVKKVGGFRYDHEAGTATVRPPGPFSGYATFARKGGNQKQKGSWSGNLSVRLLGHDPISLAGPEFDARLLRRSPFHDE